MCASRLTIVSMATVKTDHERLVSTTIVSMATVKTAKLSIGLVPDYHRRAQSVNEARHHHTRQYARDLGALWDSVHTWWGDN